MKLDTMKVRLNEIKALAEGYLRSFPSTQLTALTSLLSQAQTMQQCFELKTNDDSLTKDECNEYKKLLLTIELTILNSISQRFAQENSETSWPPLKNNEQFMELLKKARESLTTPHPKFIDIKKMNELISGPSLPTITVNAQKTHKKKPSVAKEHRIEEYKQRKELSQQVNKKEHDLQEIEETITALTQKATSDHLIKLKLEAFSPLREDLANIKKTSTQVRRKINIISALYSGLFEPSKFQSLNAEEKSTVADAFNFVNEEVKADNGLLTKINQLFHTHAEVNQVTLTANDVEVVKEKVMALARHKDTNTHKMEQELFDIEQRYQAALEKTLPEMQKIKEMIIARNEELKEIAAYSPTRAVNGSEPPLILKMQALETMLDEVKGLYERIEKMDKSTDPGDQAITELLKEHHKIYLQKTEERSKIKTSLAAIRNSKNILKYPLELDRVNAKIEILSPFIHKLKSIEGQLKISLETINNVMSKRDLAATNVQSIFDRAATYLTKVKGIKAYYSPYKDNIDRAIELLMTLNNEFITPMNSNKKSIAEIMTYEAAINNIMSPVLNNVALKKTQFNTNLQKTSTDLEKLSARVSPITFQHKVDFSLKLTGLTNTLPTPHRTEPPEEHIDSDETKLTQTNLFIENINQRLNHEITLREASALPKLINKMVSSISIEINLITDPEDSRLPILGAITANLKSTKKDYIDLKTDAATCIKNTIDTIQTNLSEDKLKKLSDNVLHPFLSFVRKLLQPLVNMVKKMTGEQYRPSFFATSTESNVAKAAEEAHTKLNLLTGQIDEKIDLAPLPTIQRP